ncbi:NPC intracellular cholesterol transporter 2 homolog a [Procambarus clarkii]|uniref:NPC intracellular cholesterol transporter 2 homolog a n=1 Tax=Procambarus clarkii TaxID=6728 RepID=UPI001E6773D4|nr:NPC intracellular cholesterol transporter 2 homolog a-like [Procambarus clarkii]
MVVTPSQATRLVVSTAAMLSSSIVLAALLGLTSATLVQDCGSTAEVTEVRITDCDIPPCILTRGEDIKVEIDFVNVKASSTLTTKVIGNIAGIDIPWAGVVPDACTSLTTGDCPLEENESVYYTADAPVLQEYPAVSVIVKWRLVDDNDETTVCFIVPAEVV